MLIELGLADHPNEAILNESKHYTRVDNARPNIGAIVLIQSMI
jgi:hypothetical protein